jgi:hypothetical protein
VLIIVFRRLATLIFQDFSALSALSSIAKIPHYQTYPLLSAQPRAIKPDNVEKDRLFFMPKLYRCVPLQVLRW